MADYKLNASGDIIRASDDACIPADPNNRDYAEFIASGKTADPYVAPPKAPGALLQDLLNELTADDVAKIRDALVNVLGKSRMDDIASTLNVPISVVELSTL